VNNKWTNNFFITEGVKRFNGKFDYSLSDCKGSKSNVLIICPIHGEFTQTAYGHLNSSHGCDKCAIERRAIKKTVTIDAFIKRANIKHNNKYNYNYSLSVYLGSKIPMKIICPEHGVFEQAPADHLKTKGCWKCGIERNRKSRLMSKKEFIQKVKNKNSDSDKCDYTFSIFNGVSQPITIICLEHGEFTQNAGNHLQGHGCPKCKNKAISERGKTNPVGWSYTNWINQSLKSKWFESYKIYVLRCWNETEEFYKIGRTFTTIKRRFQDKNAMPYNYEILKVYESKDARYICELELELKTINKQFKYIPIIKFNGREECFNFIHA